MLGGLRGRGGRGRGGRGGPAGEGGMTQTPLALSQETEIRPVIARLLSVKEWREQYLQHVRGLAEIELDWQKLGPRVEGYRDLIIADIELDPFHGDRERFLEQLDGPENSLKSITKDRQSFLLQQKVLQQGAGDNPL